MSGSFRFGDFELDVAAYTLRRRGHRIKIEKVPMEVLILLVRNAGVLVTRNDIQAGLWGSEVFVDQDAAINTAIRKIRRALDDDAEHPRLVETVVGKGYRFIAPVAEHVPLADVTNSGPKYLLMRGKRQFPLETGENLLGRDPQARVCVDHPSVSRRHARISIDSTSAVLEDLKSRNGTFLDGRRLDAPTEIHQGAIIGLGPITLALVVLPAAASTLPMDDRSGRS